MSSEFTAEISAVITAVGRSATTCLDTFDEIVNVWNDGHTEYDTLLAFVNAKQATLTVPSAAEVTLFKNTDTRGLEATRNNNYGQ